METGPDGLMAAAVCWCEDAVGFWATATLCKAGMRGRGEGISSEHSGSPRAGAQEEAVT